MTLEEAVKLLKQYQGYEPMFPDGEKLKHAFDLTDETVDTLLTALRGPTREQVEKVWSLCNFCAGAKYITGGVTAVYPVSETRQQETLAEGDFDFCPVCGRPITDEAVDMMLERWKEAVSNG